MTRTDIINSFIKKYNYNDYLEIGVRNGDNFNQILAKNKIGVDPDLTSKATVFKTSDDFFRNSSQLFDIVFIDGLHFSEQVYTDILNSLSHLKENGVIVLHDCLPTHEIATIHEVQTTGDWNGDVWKGFLKYREESPYECYVIDNDYGCGVIDTHIRRISSVDSLPSIGDLHDKKVRDTLDWRSFTDNKNEWMNVKKYIQFQN